MSGACGPCNLCCTVMGVVFDDGRPKKEGGTRCEYAKCGGCSIYPDRPTSCREFQCLWLYTQGNPRGLESMPRHLRPDKTGVVLEANSAGYIVAHSHRPAQWRKQPIYDFLLTLAWKTRVIVHSGDDVYLLNGMGETTELHFIGVSKETNERLYATTEPV